MEFITFIRSLGTYMDRPLLEAISAAYQTTIDPTVHIDTLAEIIAHCDHIDYKLSEMELIQYFESMAIIGHDAFFDSLTYFAKHMFTKYTTYTKSHVNRFMDDLPDEFMKSEYFVLVNSISTCIKEWSFASDSEMLSDIKHECDIKLPNIRMQLGTNFDSFVHSLFVSEKMNRLYHLTKELFLPQLQKL